MHRVKLHNPLTLLRGLPAMPHRVPLVPLVLGPRCFKTVDFAVACVEVARELKAFHQTPLDTGRVLKPMRCLQRVFALQIVNKVHLGSTATATISNHTGLLVQGRFGVPQAPILDEEIKLSAQCCSM